MVALLLAIGALIISFGAAVYTRSSAQSASNAVALTLSTDVQIRLLAHDGLTHNRWMYNEQSVLVAPQGWEPPGATPGIFFSTPGEDNVIIGVAVPITVKNSGSRRADLALTGDFAIAKGFSMASAHESISGDWVIPRGAFALDAGKSQNFVLYQGMKVKDWFSSGKSSSPVEFHFPISASAGVDSVTQHWDVLITAAIFEAHSGSDSAARVVATPTPVPQLRENHRTYPTRAFSLRYRLRSPKVDK